MGFSMFLKILFSLLIVSFAVETYATTADESTCRDMMAWRNEQPEEKRFFEAYMVDQGTKLRGIGADEYNKMKSAFEEMSDSDSPMKAEEKCNQHFKSAFNKAKSRAFNFAQRSRDEDAPLHSEGLSVEVGAVLGSSGEKELEVAMELDRATPGTGEKGICNFAQIAIDGNCILNATMMGIPLSFEQIMSYEESISTPTPAKYSPEDCKCRDENLEKAHKSKAKIMASAPSLRDEVKKVISKEAGKKFLNEFSAYLEDAQFYTTNKAWVLSNNKKDLEHYQCSNAADYMKLAKDLCQKNGTEAGMEARMAEVLGAFGDNFHTPGADLQIGLNALVKDVNTYTEDVRKVAKDKPNILTRAQYDPVRFTMGRDQPQVNFVNHITTIIIRDKDLKSKLQGMLDEGKTPLFGVMEILSGKSDPELTKKLLRLLEKKHPFLSNKVKSLTSKFGTEEYGPELANTFHHALNLHPGLKNILINPAMFSDVVPLVEKGSKMNGMMTIVEDQKNLMTMLFVGRCGNVQRAFAEAVCTKEDDLLSKVSSKDLASIIKQHPELASNQEAADLLICKMNENEQKSNSIFNNLNVVGINPYKASDYLDRKLNPDHQKNGLANLLNSSNKDPNLASKITKLTQLYNHERSTLGGSKEAMNSASPNAMNFLKSSRHAAKSMASDVLRSENEIGKSEITPKNSESERTRTPASVSDVASGASKVINQVMPAFAGAANNFTQSAPLSQVGQVAPVTSTVGPLSLPQEKLRQSLSGSSDKAQLEKMISNISSSDAQDLLDMQARMIKNKEVISEQQLEQERKKTQDMADEYQEHVKKGEPNGPKTHAAVAEGVSRSSFSTGGFMGAAGPSLPQGTTSSSSSSSAGEGKIRDVASVQSAVNANAMADNKKEASLVIASQTKDGSKAKEDPSGDLMTYLNSNETDGQTLRNLKESGIIYSYQIVDETGKTVTKQKLVKYADLSPAAKLLVDNKLSAVTTMALRRAHSIQALRLELLSTLHKTTQKL